MTFFKSTTTKRFVFALVDLGARSPLRVLGVALVILILCASYTTRKLEVRSDVMELLPRDSPGFMAFERRLNRVGGRATITLICESPDRAANERCIDAMTAALHKSIAEEGQGSIAFIESGTKDIRTFLETNKWLYAEIKELEEADTTLDHQIAIKSGLVDDLEASPTAADAEQPQRTLGMEKYEQQWKDRADEHDNFPSGYFATPDGTRIALWIISNSAGMGAADDDVLLARIQKLIDNVHPETFHPSMKVGLGGDIPNAKSEKDALIGEAVIATGIAALLIIIGIAWFYRSLWSIPLVFFPPLFGVGCAYAFATAKYGFVNSSGAFLGAIILGNGVNYPIVLYSRYKEFRARGMDPVVARREAVWNAFRAELVGATVASIAYGSLSVTRFRGFSQFGVIGFFGMLLVWIAMIPCVPAFIVVIERLQARLPSWMRESPSAIKVAEDGSRGLISRLVGNATSRYPRAFVFGALLITIVALFKLPSFLRDPWEYDFDKLGSTEARKTGAFQWTTKADAIVRGKNTLEGALVLADKPEQVQEVKARILANDAALNNATPLIDSINTVHDYLPGTTEEQTAKLAVLERIRDRITPGVLARMSDEEAKKLRELTPPETLHLLTPNDLPSALQRRFRERDGTLGTPFYINYRPGVSTEDGHTLLKIAATVDGISLPDGTQVDTASRSTVFAEMIRSLERDGPLATGVSFAAVVLVVLLATWSKRGAFSVILTLVLGVAWTLGFAALLGVRLNFLNFIALPITFGIGSEYPFNIYDRARLLGGDIPSITNAVKLHFGAVALCSYTTVIGYSSLLFADNQALQSFGKLSMAGELACVVLALLFLPALLHLLGSSWRRGRRRRNERSPSVETITVASGTSQRTG